MQAHPQRPLLIVMARLVRATHDHRARSGVHRSPAFRSAPAGDDGKEDAADGAGWRFVVAGGVAANGEIRRVLQATAERHGFSFTAPPLKYCGDNAAMIALAGAERLALGLIDGMDAVARPRWPLDEAAARERPTHIPGRKGAKA